MGDYEQLCRDVNAMHEEITRLSPFEKYATETSQANIRMQQEINEVEYERDRYKAGLEMIAQFISGNVRAIRSIALAVLKGADVRNLEEVEAIR